ncbi:non-ribosomal peptide synthetase [Brevibacillus halotolerans]|uniref:non-ribosomal peptide synthetase n=1 Tax=Brevibacillus halotolerans TaxID=1507437 RepID=UPI001B2B56C2|nr:non-ribosomal peptide synthetase [Brevibacillus halotolerans]GIO01643.1 non-ribosomal peptide synthetase [Brevibacillus halotolerans]
MHKETERVISETYSLTHPQKRIWYTEQLYSNSSISNLAGFIRVKGNIDYSLLIKAIHFVTENNSDFQIRLIQNDDEEPKQYFAELEPIEIPLFDIHDFEDFDGWANRESQIPFEQIQSRLYAFSIIRVSDKETLIFGRFHHIMIDGVSLDFLAKQIFEAYANLMDNELQPQKKASSYVSFIGNEQEYLSSPRFEKDRTFWHQKFSTLPEFISLKDYNSYQIGTEAQRKTIQVPKELTHEMHEFCENYTANIFSIFLATLYVYVYKMTGQRDIAIGTVYANRTTKEEKEMLGMFVSTFPLRTYLDPHIDFVTFLQHVNKEKASILRHQKYPYDLLIQHLRKNNPQTDRLFGICIEYRPLKWDEIGGVTYQTESLSHGHEINDVNIHIVEEMNTDELKLYLDYRTELFTEQEIDSMINGLLNILQQVMMNPSQPLSEIELLSEEEKHQVLFTFNDTNAEYPMDKTISMLFEEQVEKTPNHIAVVWEDRQFTYRELNERANQLARTLLAKGVRREQLIGIMADRSLDMIVGILGILKAGGAYVPIDPDYPNERIQFLLEDSQVDVLLLQRQLLFEPPFQGRMLYLDDEELYTGDASNPISIAQPQDVAYVIYTSGTTGKPKGVLIEHKNVVRLLFTSKPLFDFNEADVWTIFHSFCFDFSVWEMYGALLYGGKLVIIPKAVAQDPAVFWEVIQREQVTVLNQTPSAFYSLVQEELSRVKSDIRLRKVIFGGEALLPTRLKQWKEKYPQVMFINMYGITETTVHVTYKEIHQADMDYPTSNIGKPIPTLSCYILDEQCRPVPIGVVGELYVSGEGVARGYLNRPELTAERFIENPFLPGKRMYKTGDLAKWLPNGDMEYGGRKDQQVKIRGHRIELGEIESQLLEMEKIQDAAVISRPDRYGQSTLYAYVVLKDGFTIKQTREALIQALPSFMIPAYFVSLECIPLTSNGKVNRQALPEPNGDNHSGVEYTAPRNPVEEALSSVWQEILGVNRIGIADNFFQLGGDSIKALQVCSHMRKLGYELSVKSLLQHPSIAEVSSFVRKFRQMVDQGPIEGEVNITPIQMELFQKQEGDGLHHYNQSVLLYRRNGFNPSFVCRAFERLTEHHDALRIQVSRSNEGSWAQYNRGLEGQKVHVHVVDMTQETDIAARIAEEELHIQRSMNLTTCPTLVKLGIFCTAMGDHLLITIHHLVVDGVSWRILLEDFSDLYRQLEANEEMKLPAKTTSYREYASQLQSFAGSKKLIKELAYWKEIESVSFVPLPKDGEALHRKQADERLLSLTLSEEETELLLKETHRAYHTEINDILLTALGLAVQQWTGQEQVLISLEGHGREEILPGVDISRTVGWFTSIYPVLLDLRTPDQIHLRFNSLGYQIKRVKNGLRRIPNKGIGYGIAKYMMPKEHKQAIAFQAQPDIRFNYLGQFDNDIQRDVFQRSTYQSQHMVSGEALRAVSLDINAMVMDGSLTLTVGYHREEYKEATVVQFLESFLQYIRDIILHCAGRTETEKTASDFSSHTLTTEEWDVLSERWKAEGSIADIEDIYPLSYMQEGMLFHYLKEEGTTAYFEQATFKLAGDLHIPAFEQSVNELLNRYDVLRTVFIYEELAQPQQVVWKQRILTVHAKDLSDMEENQQAAYIEAFKENDRKRGFDIQRDLLLRISIFKTKENRYTLIWGFHHLIMDGWCLGIIFIDVFHNYHALQQGKTIRFDKAPSYRKYIEWLYDNDREEALSYWRNYLDNYTQQTTIPRTEERGDHGAYHHEELSLTLDETLTERLLQLAQVNQVTVNTVFQAIWAILIRQYNRTDDVVFGTVVSGRSAEIPGIEQMVGLFINTIPVRVRFGQMSFRELLQQIQQRALETEPFTYCPLYEVQAQSKLRQHLFDHLLVFENYPIEQGMKALSGSEKQGLQIEGIEFSEHNNYDFTVTVIPGKEIKIIYSYNAHVLERKRVESIAGHLNQALTGVTMNPDCLLEEVEILTEQEKMHLLVECNDTKADYPHEKTIHQIFEEQARSHSDKIAVAIGDSSLTYRELNEKANQLARVLRAKGVEADQLIGILCERSIEMIVGILGVLKAGGAYVPIDPDYPQERMRFILSDSACHILLTQSHLVAKTEFFGEQILLDCLDYAQAEPTDLAPINTPNDLAYVIYTSGTTGTPKGVLIEHRNVVRLLYNDKSPFNFNSNDIWTLFHSYCFDFSVWEMYGALLYGGKLVIVPKEVTQDPQLFVRLLEEQCVTILNQTPTAFYQVMHEEMQTEDSELSLRMVIFGGEALAPAKLKSFKEKYRHIKLINMYGITETTVHVTYKDISDEEIKQNSSDIGKPIPTLTTYVLDPRNKLVPVGVPGELHVGGDGLARGYLNRVELTSEKFIQNPYALKQRLYKSGDLVRRLPNGNLEYLGRIDHQVKIRGHRIELGEIERKLLEHPAIKEATVLAIEGDGGHKWLCAYFTADPTLAVSEVKVYLAKQLPSFMVPAYFILLENMPLTSNGKVDRKALPQQTDSLRDKRSYEAPRNELERQLAEIWQDMLSVEQIGIHDNFFDLGGDSIRAIGLVNKMNRHCRIHVQIRQMYLYPTISMLVEHIQSQTADDQYEEMYRAAIDAIEAGKARLQEDVRFVEHLTNVEDLHPMSEISRGMIYHGLQTPEAALYHDQIVYRFKDDSYEHDVMVKTVELLVEKHSMLRSSFHIHNFPEPVQLIHQQVAMEVNFFELTDKTAEERERFIADHLAKDRQHPFATDVHKPLWRLHVYTLDEQCVLLAWIFHHAIMDGWSVASLMTEITTVYHSLKERKPLEIEPLKSSYKDFVIEQLAIKNNPASKRFWQEELAYYKRWELPGIKGSGEETENATHNVITQPLDSSLVTHLKRTAQQLDTTLKTVCFTAFLSMLRTYAFEEEVVAGLVENARPVCEDGEKILGCFLTTVPFRIKFEQNITWAELIRNVHRKHVELKEYGRLPLLDICRATGENAYGKNPFFDVMFNYVDFHVFNNIAENAIEVNNVLFEMENSYERTNMLLDFSISTTLGHNLIKIGSVLPQGIVQQMMQTFLRILELMVADVNGSVDKMDIILPEEKATLLSTFNQAPVCLPTEEPIHRLLEKAAEQTPDRIALQYQDRQMTFQEVNQRANQLAHHLCKRGVTANQLVGIITERSFDMIVGILAVLKAGGAYVPIDPDFPADRIEYILRDSQANVLLAHSGLVTEVSFTGQIVFIDQEESYEASKDNLEIIPEMTDLAYVIYTSGSTGLPKGVTIEHANLIHILQAHEYLYPLEANDAFLLKTNYTFDVSIIEIFGWIVGRGRLVILEPGAEKEPLLIMQAIERHYVTHINFVPSMLNWFVYSAGQINAIQQLKYIFAAGEALASELANKIREALPGVRLENLYGPTEASVYATSYSVQEYVEKFVPIGKPLPDVQIFILSRMNQLQPMGVVGELCIAGSGVARGYLNRPDLTAEKFVSNRITGKGTLYKTGDLARWLPDGNIEYLGRLDHQVKIRGYRIELGEIEAGLLQAAAAREAAVIARENAYGQQELCAYVVTKEELSVSKVRKALSALMPNYMIPSHIVQLDRMPVTSSGKLDRNALPEPKSYQTARGEYVAPSSETEELLMRIWQDVLEVPQIGIHDHFFELGGDSIKALQISSRLYQQGFSITVKDLFQYPTIGELSPYVGSIRLSIDQGLVEGDVVLTPIQRTFLEQQEKHGLPSQSVVLYRRNGFEEKAVHEVFERMLAHHDALRMVYSQQAGDWKQHNRGAEGKMFSLEIADVSHEADIAAKVEESVMNIQQAMDVERGPLVKLTLFRSAGGDYLRLAIHPLVIDIDSWKIVLEDFATGYSQWVAGEAIGFPLKTTSYLDYSTRLSEYANKPRLLMEQQFWRGIEDIQIAELPKDIKEPNHLSRDKLTMSVRLTEQETNQLLHEAHEAYSTDTKDLLLTALGLSVQRWTGEKQTLVNLAGNGREEEILGEIDLSRTVGAFTSVYPVVLDMAVPNGLAKEDELSLQIKSIKDSLRRIPDKGISYGALQYLIPEDKKEIAPCLNPEIALHFLGQLDLESASQVFEISSVNTKGYMESALVITAFVVKGAMTLEVGYNRQLFNKGTIEQFMASFQQQLRFIIAHCVSREKEQTLTDFSDEDLTLDELQDISGFLSTL